MLDILLATYIEFKTSDNKPYVIIKCTFYNPGEDYLMYRS